ncbi:MAG: hypothetical protein BZ136_03145 [Methanosphaera sp. rholeuAM74]|nr:MAG: hypothetical protein BZ136_03145 [Methanosphaera sp. rholeuAM74]
MKQLQKIKKLQQEIKIHKKEIKTNTQELDKIEYDKKRIQKIFTAKTHKQATRRFNTIYNQRTQVNTHIQHFLEKNKTRN